MTSPYAFTDEELKMMRIDYKKPKAKKWFVAKQKPEVERFNKKNLLMFCKF